MKKEKEEGGLTPNPPPGLELPLLTFRLQFVTDSDEYKELALLDLRNHTVNIDVLGEIRLIWRIVNHRHIYLSIW